MTLAGAAIEGLSVKINDCSQEQRNALCLNGMTFDNECELCYRAALRNRISKYTLHIHLVFLVPPKCILWQTVKIQHSIRVYIFAKMRKNTTCIWKL